MITYTNKFKSDNVDSSSLLQQLGTSSANTTCLQLVNRFVATCLQIGSNLCIFTRVSLFIAEVMELRCFQTVYTRKNAQVVTDLQTSCAGEGCSQADISRCSHCLFPVVTTSLEQLVITLLYKVDGGNRLVTN